MEEMAKTSLSRLKARLKVADPKIVTILGGARCPLTMNTATASGPQHALNDVVGDRHIYLSLLSLSISPPIIALLSRRGPISTGEGISKNVKIIQQTRDRLSKLTSKCTRPFYPNYPGQCTIYKHARVQGTHILKTNPQEDISLIPIFRLLPPEPLIVNRTTRKR